MKKLLCILVFIASCSVFAQTTPNENLKRKTTFGIKAGFNAMVLQNLNERKYVEGRTQDILGSRSYIALFSETAFNDRWSLGNEIIYAHGAQVGFVEIPVLVKYRATKRWKFFAGPKLDLAVTDRNNKSKWDVTQTLGFSVDVGVEYNLGKHWFTELRYSYGFTDMFERPGYRVIDAPTSTRSAIKLGIGYRF